MKKKELNEIETPVGTCIVSPQNAITLIALIITIIVLLILAGITISLTIGEDGIFGLAYKSVEKQKMAEYEEKIELSRSKALGNNKGIITIEDLINQIYNDNIVQEGSIKKLDEEKASLITKEGYEFIITTIKTEYVGINKASTITVSKKIVGIEGDYLNILVTIEDERYGIKEIVKPDGLVIKNDNKTKISIDYKVEKEKDYIFTITNGTGETKTVIINTKIQVPVSKITLNKTTEKTVLTKSLELQVTKIEPENADIKEVKWSSSNTYIATVSDTGVVTPKAIGTVAIICSSVDGGASATCTVEVVDGTLIYTREDLEAIPEKASQGKTYILMNDIDLAGKNWTTKVFYGTFDGNGHIISNLSGTGGLFSGINCQSFSILNLKLNNVNIVGRADNGAFACNVNSGHVELISCGATGRVSGEGNCGGLVGATVNGCKLKAENCYSRLSVSCDGGERAYGFAVAYGGNSVKNSYSSCDVSRRV